MLAPGDAATFTATFTPGSAPLTSLRVVVSDGFRVNIVNLSPLSGGTASGELTPAADWLNGGYLITSEAQPQTILPGEAIGILGLTNRVAAKRLAVMSAARTVGTEVSPGWAVWHFTVLV